MKDKINPTKEASEESLRFCPGCGYEGNDLICPLCAGKTESLADDVARLAKKENQPSGIFDDEVSLEEERDKENAAEGEDAESSTS